MFCKNCGASLIDGMNFCSSCGTPVPPADAPLTPDPETTKTDPIFDEPQPAAPMYTPVAQEQYPEPAYTVPEVPQNEVDSILTWGIVGLVCTFVFTILGIVFSAIAVSKSKKCLNAYGYLPQQAKTGRTLGLIGLITSIVFTVLGILLIIAFIGLVAVGAVYY